MPAASTYNRTAIVALFRYAGRAGAVGCSSPPFPQSHTERCRSGRVPPHVTLTLGTNRDLSPGRRSPPPSSFRTLMPIAGGSGPGKEVVCHG
jgi:hypothetical protein